MKALHRSVTAAVGLDGDHLHTTLQKPLRASTSCVLLREVEVPARKPAKPPSAFVGLDNKLIDLCHSNVALRRRMVHLSMTHSSSSDMDGETDEIELIAADAPVDDEREKEILALLNKQRKLQEDGKCNPSVHRLKSQVDLPEAIDQDVALAIQHDMIMTVPAITWTAKFEKQYHLFKQSKPKSNLNSVQLFRSYLMTPDFRAMHAVTYGATRFHEDTTGEFASTDLDVPLQQGIHKRFERLSKPMRDSLELSLSNHMLENFDQLLAMYTTARRTFLSHMTKRNKLTRRRSRKAKEDKAELQLRRVEVQKEVAKTRAALGTQLIPARLHTPRDPSLIEGSNKHAVTTIVSASKRAAAKSWKKIKDSEKCNVARSLQLSIEYAKTVPVQGGGLPSKALCTRQQEELRHHIIYIQRLYRGHMARRYVYSLKWLFFMWRHLFFPSTVLPSDTNYGFMHIDDFEASYEYFCYQSNAERVYLAGFALTVPPSRLGGQYIEYHRFKRYWLRFMYRAPTPADMVRFVQFVRNREAIVHSIEMQRLEKSEIKGSKDTTLTYLTQLDDFKKFNYTKRREDHSKYKNDFTSNPNDEYRVLALKARRALLPKAQQLAKGWTLLRYIILGNPTRATKVRSFKRVVGQLDEVEGIFHRDMIDLPAPRRHVVPNTSIQARRRPSVISSYGADSTNNESMSSDSRGRFERHLLRLTTLASEAEVLSIYYDTVGVKANKSSDEAVPVPLCVARLSKLKHWNGISNIAELLTKLEERNNGFVYMLKAFEMACTEDSPSNITVLANIRSYLTDGMELLTLIRHQLCNLRPPKQVVGAAMIVQQREKRLHLYTNLLSQFESNVRVLSQSLVHPDEAASCTTSMNL